MVKTRIEKIESIKTEIEQLENRRKKLIQQQKEQERKDRTRRLCKRAGLLESMLPETITLTDDHFKTFLEKALLKDTSRRILNSLTSQVTTESKAISSNSVTDSYINIDEDATPTHDTPSHTIGA